ncbi:MAG TPA: C25 family cysteine peptidase [Thermoanaerobaculia bacterium]|nr:C25 family cysteine peptidase [Thermoanaerobaculia bacterium]
MKGTRSRWICHLVIVAMILLSAGSVLGQGTAGYSEYYLPGDELNMYYIFNDLDVNGGSTAMHSVISVVAWSANTTLYYDHWENGYNFDPNNPGATADETATLATQGATRTFESSNVASGGPPPALRNPAVVCAGQGNPGNRCYDGGDRIFAAGGPVTVTRAVWMEARGAGNQGDAWEIYPVVPQLTTYVLPFGENNFATSGTFFTGFERVYALVQATDDNTTFSVDLDNNGTADVLNQNRNATWNDVGDGAVVTLQRGQTFLLDRISACSAHVTCTTFPGGGTLNSGAVITGDKTLQVKYVAGRTATTYTARGLSAFPRGFWTEDYYAPFGQGTIAGRPTDYYLFNPGAAALTVNWQSQTGAGSFSIPANSTQSFNRAIGANPSVPIGSGLYFSAATPFWGVGFGDSTNDLREWGFSLLPTSFLFDEHFLGWSPGSLPLLTAPTNGNGIFLTVAQDNTRVFVDYDNNGTADQTYTLNRLQEQFVPVGPTGDLAGARFWATGQFTMAYGEHPTNSNTPTPNLDLGYVALPGTDFISLVLTVDKTANPSVVATTAGTTTTFTLSTKSKLYSVDQVSVVDTLPPNWQYVAGSATVIHPDNTTATPVNPTITGTGSAANPFVLTWSAAQTGGNMAPNQEIRITFQASTMIALPTGTLSQNRVVSSGTRTVGSPSVTQTFKATDFCFVASGEVQITKASSAATPLYPGDAFTYTTTVTNPAAAGTNLLTGVSLFDTLPNGVTTVAGTTSLSRSTVADNFDTAGNYATNAGTRNWAAGWVEVNDGAGAGAGAGDFSVVGGELRLTNNASNEPTLSRAVSLTGATQARLSFRYRTDTGVDAGDILRVLGGTAGTGGAFGTTITTITGITGAATDTVSFDISALIGANTAIRFTINDGLYQGANENIFIDDISITYNVAVTGPNPPDLIPSSALYSLVGGQNIVATFNVTVDNPFPTGQTVLTNTAATTSVQIPAQIIATVTNNVTTPTVLSASVAGRLWLDADADASQDIGEPGLDNVLVTLKDQFGTPIATTTTDSNGRFLFTGVTPGNGYYVEATNPPDPGSYPSGLTQSFPIGSTNDRTSTFNLASGQNYTQANIGYKATATTSTFGDLVWVDVDADGVRDAGEIGLGGATLTLYKDANGNGVLNIGTDTLIGTTTSASDGSYLFSGVTPNAAGTDTFFVTTSTPATYTASTPVSVRFLNVAPGSSYLSADFGFLPGGTTFTITDRVWFDANANGLFAAETGIAGVTVELLDGSLNVIGTTITASDGTFSFSGLPGAGADYTTRITDMNNVLADYYGTTSFAIALQRAETNLNANVNRSAAPSYGFNLTRSIGDTVYNDLNGSGAQDAGEPGFAGVTVSLFRDTNGNGQINAGEPLVGTVVTDTNGQYLFSGLTNGNYVVSVPTPGGYNYIAGGRPDTDGATAGIQLAATIAGGANVLTRDFGFQAATPRTVSGTLWNDANSNGTMNVGEGKFQSVSIEVLSSAAGTGTLAVTNQSATVTGTGTTFTNLSPGDPIVIGGVTYRILSIASNTSLTLTEKYAGATASGLAWTTRGAILFTTTTDVNGAYSFAGLAATSYFVRVTDSMGTMTGYGPTWERTEGLINLNNPADSIEAVNLIGASVAGVDFGFAQLSALVTYVKMRAFDGVQRGKKVTLHWQTSFESNNLGFNIYRDSAGTLTKVNKKMIAGSAFITKRSTPVAGYSYQLTDHLPSENTFAQYWLEDVDTTGVKTKHGPITPLLRGDSGGGGNAIAPVDSASLSGLGTNGSVVANPTGIGVLRPTTIPPATNAQISQQLELAGNNALKVYVNKEGWYRITKSQMTAAGFDPGNNSKKLGVFCLGVEQPIVVNGTTGNDFESIEFYALGLDTPSTAARTYWIRIGSPDGKRLGTPAAGSGSPQTDSVPFVYQRIDRSIAVPQFQGTGEGEIFFGPIITMDPVTQDLAVSNFDSAASALVTLDITIRGAIEDMEHRTDVALNGYPVGIAILQNAEQKSFSFQLPHSALVLGANVLRLTALNGENDVSVLVSAKLTYRHLLLADDGMFEAELPASRTVTIKGFPDTNIRALDVTDLLNPQPIAVTAAPDGGAFKATFTTPSAATPRTVMVFSSNRILPAPEMDLNRPSSWASSGSKLRADLVIITHRNFATAAASLQATRNAEETKTEVVDVDDIYDEQNFGVRSPEAIRSFVQSLKLWKKAPTNVLLIGDASIDPRGYLELDLVDFVPTKLVQTVYLKAPSDGWFADFDGTGIESIGIGRLPVRTPEDAALVVGKITSRGKPAGDWSKSVLMIADVPETYNFEGSIAALTNLLPNPYRTATTSIKFGSTPNPGTALVNSLNAGQLLVNYVGHGSVELWSNNVFNSSTATGLANGNRLPFIVGMTCLNTYFHDLYSLSLGEALLNAPNGGAVAVWSSSTLTEPGPQLVMNQQLLRSIFGLNITLGDAIRSAKAATSDPDVRRSWILLGDPSMKLTK